MGLGGLQHYTIEPADLERTKDFYCDVLGKTATGRRGIPRSINPIRPPPRRLLTLHEVGMQHWQPKHEVPDKAAGQPSVGRQSAGFSSSLHDDWRGRAAAAR
jgi:catechol 2,3-dioxygenase-like lactoylglutathione lyase family enzyme